MPKCLCLGPVERIWQALGLLYYGGWKEGHAYPSGGGARNCAQQTTHDVLKICFFQSHASPASCFRKLTATQLFASRNH